MAYDKCENFRRPDNMAMLHINEFERLNHRIRHFGINLPTGPLVDKAINDANIFTKKQLLIGATVNLFTYKCMKKQVKAINYTSEGFLGSENFQVKLEPVFFANKSGRDNDNKCSKDGDIRGDFCILSKEEFSKVTEEENSTKLKFGDGYSLNLLKFVTFPRRIDKKDINRKRYTKRSAIIIE